MKIRNFLKFMNIDRKLGTFMKINDISFKMLKEF